MKLEALLKTKLVLSLLSLLFATTLGQTIAQPNPIKEITDHKYALEEINAMCEAAKGEVVKVIVRSSELTEEELVTIAEIVGESKAQFIKNSTGMDAYGAMPEHMRIMREIIGNKKGA